MDLILASYKLHDIETLKYLSSDIEIGSENDFEIKIKREDFHDNLTFGNIIYIPQTEYGGIIGEIDTDTSLDEISLAGYCWRGLLSKKVIRPPSGADYKIVSGELNNIIRSLISEYFYTVFEASDIDTGVTINNYQFERYTDLLTGIKKMLDSVGYKIQIKYIQGEAGYPGKVELSAVPIIDYSDTKELSQDSRLDFTFKNVKNCTNHLICLGTGELKNRVVVDLYVKSDGTIGTNQYYRGIDEIVEVYEDTNATAEELTERGTERLEEIMNYSQFKMDVAMLGINIEIGDIVGGRDYITGLYTKQPIIGKIWKKENGKESIEYKVEGEN